MNTTLARRYAKVACANLAPSSAQTLAADLRRCKNLIESQPLLREVLRNPRLRHRAQAVLTPLLVRLELSQLATRLVGSLIKNGRASLLPTVVDAIGELALARAGQLRAQVTAAAPLSEAQQAALCAALHRATGKAILLAVEVDPALLGGLRAQVGDFYFDTTLRGHLARLREHILRKQAVLGHAN